METPILQIKQLNKVFSVGEKNFSVIKDVNLSFSCPGLVLISGKSGSGKSTLLNLIAGILKPTDGHVFFDGKAIDEMGEKHICAYRNRKLGYIFQHYNLFDKQSVLFNIVLPLLIDGRGIEKAYEMGRALLHRYSMIDYANRDVMSLSGGEKQRVAVLRSIVNDPAIVLADEPTGALDSQNATLTMEMLLEIAKQKMVLVVSHNVEFARQFSYRHIIIKDGSVFSDSLINDETQ